MTAGACIWPGRRDGTDRTPHAKPEWKPDLSSCLPTLGFGYRNTGWIKWGDLFTPRQLVALTTFSDLVQEAREQVRRDALAAGVSDDGKALRDGGAGATAYAEAVGVYLAFAYKQAADLVDPLYKLGTVSRSTRCTFGSASDPDGLGLRRSEPT